MTQKISTFKLVVALDTNTTEEVLTGFRQIAMLESASENSIVDCLKQYFTEGFTNVLTKDYSSSTDFLVHSEIIDLLKEDSEYLDEQEVDYLNQEFDLDKTIRSSNKNALNSSKVWLEYSDTLNIDDVVPKTIRLFPKGIDEYFLELTYKTKNSYRCTLKIILYMSAFSKIYDDFDEPNKFSWRL